MNKKGVEMTVRSIIIIILALMFLIVLIWGFTTVWNSDSEPEFKITKKGCENITKIDHSKEIIVLEEMELKSKFSLAGLEELSIKYILFFKTRTQIGKVYS